MVSFPNGGLMPNWPSGDTHVNNNRVAVTPGGAVGPQGSIISGIMRSVLSGGAGAAITDPTAAANSLLSATAAATGGLTGALGSAAAPLVAALTGSGGLVPALASLASVTSAMAGLTAPVGAQKGPLDLLQHAVASSTFFGPSGSEPSSVSVAAAAAPLQSAPMLTTANATVSNIISSVISGGMSVAAAVTQVNSLTAQINALAPASQSAISTLQAAQPALTNVLTIAGMASSTSATIQNIASLLTGSGPMQSLTNAMIAASAATTNEIDCSTSFPDPSASQPGATGGVFLASASFLQYLLTAPKTVPSQSGVLWNNGGFACVSISGPLFQIPNLPTLNYAYFQNLPTVEPTVSGLAWNNGGVIALSANGPAAISPDPLSVYLQSLPKFNLPAEPNVPWINVWNILCIS